MILFQNLSEAKGSEGKKDRILSFAGAWENMETATIDEFTKNLIANRQENRGRIDE